MKIPNIALTGNPNSGKTALFNALTGSNQKVGNYPGVTVEKKEGLVTCADGSKICLIDLPGIYSLDAQTPDEFITQSVLLGKIKPEPDAMIVVVDATNLQRGLALVLEIKKLGYPILLALNMMDLAENRGEELDLSYLEESLELPVVSVSAIKKRGILELLEQTQRLLRERSKSCLNLEWKKPTAEEIYKRFNKVDRIVNQTIQRAPAPLLWSDQIDRWLLHPFFGILILGTVLTLLFQSIFYFAKIPMHWIELGVQWFHDGVGKYISDGALKSLLMDGIINGAGSVLVFLPQILLLFLFISFLEDSGYMARAAFLMDRMMNRVGLHGRAFIPLLSSYACAVPGIMATRTIQNPRDRLVTILVIPLITCSARLPVYSLLIGAFIPDQKIWGWVGVQGLVMLGLYFLGIAAALLLALLFRKTLLKGDNPPLILELPSYRWPSIQTLWLGLLEKAKIFVVRVGTVILALSIVLWFLASYPKPPEGSALLQSTSSSIAYSYAGQIGKQMEPFFKPIGFNWQIAVALIPGFAAREIMIGALATVYAVETEHQDEHGAALLGPRLSSHWSLATALSLLVWYVFSCQCFSTLAMTYRETNSIRWPVVMFGYMMVLAYAFSFLTFRVATALGGG